MCSVSDAALANRGRIYREVAELERLLRDAAIKYRRPSLTMVAEVLQEYWRGVSTVLGRFGKGDEAVAWWTQVELFSGGKEFGLRLDLQGDLIDLSGCLYFSPPRSALLEEWSLGLGPGPRFRGQEYGHPERVDTLREVYVRPFSEAPSDMEWAPILAWQPSRGADSEGDGRFE